jgi:nitrogen fixation protein NifQ
MSAVPKPQQNARLAAYDSLSSRGISSPNHKWLSCMLASWRVGEGMLPDYLGLEATQFSQLQAQLFPHALLPTSAVSGSQLDYDRMLEKRRFDQTAQTTLANRRAGK